MPLRPGTRLGPYEIAAPLGAGGMGEVWRAKDTRLDRDVAIKVLPPGLAENERLKQRFEREAKAISQLNHPHVCTLYDVGQARLEEDSGSAGRGSPAPGSPVHYLVMEYLEGESLADLIRRGPLPLSDVLRFGQQIASALDVAHRHGITHRDLKPGNVMVTKSGAKLLDFGLAKMAAGTQAQAEDLTNLPTQQKPLTREGTILGTFQYMAPEQLEGLEADGRTDIFALGAVLYEMATGRRAFEGRSKTSLIAAIISSQPEPISSVTKMTPPALDHVVRKCLEKDPGDRWQSAHDVASELQWISEAGSQAGVPAPVTVRRKTRERMAWGIAMVALLAAAVFGILWNDARQTPIRRVVRSSLQFPEGVRSNFDIGGLAISPDGSQIVFVGLSARGGSQIWCRSLDGRDARPIAGTENGIAPFWSPDGRSIGFFADQKLKRVDVAGGLAQSLADAPDARGGTWSEDGTIVYAPSNPGPLYRVSSSGGAAERLTEVDKSAGEINHRFPVFLPGGRKLLFLAQTGEAQSENDRSAIFLLDLDTNVKKKLVQVNSAPLWAPPDFLLFWRDGYLAAQKFNAEKGELLGEPLTAAEGVEYTSFETPVASASRDGTLVYQPSLRGGLVQLEWVDREGRKVETIPASADRYLVDYIRLSPDGRQLLFAGTAARAGAPDLWIRDLERGTETRLTFEPSGEFRGTWSPDGRTIYFMSDRTSPDGVFSMAANGEREEHKIAQGFSVWDVFPDGGTLLVTKRDANGVSRAFRYSLSNHEMKPLTSGSDMVTWPRLSPDGTWIAWESGASPEEIYVSRVDGNGKWQISTGGGHFPVWSHDSRTVYFVGPQSASIWAVDVETRGGPRFSAPQKLFDVQFTRRGSVPFDVAPGGKRFLVSTSGGDVLATPLALVQNWTAGLKR